jgi:hypothetical protein
VKNQSHNYSIGEGSKRGHIKKKFRGRGVGIIKVGGLIFSMFIVVRMDMRKGHVESHGIKLKKGRNKRKKNVNLLNGKLLNSLILLLLNAILTLAQNFICFSEICLAA